MARNGRSRRENNERQVNFRTSGCLCGNRRSLCLGKEMGNGDVLGVGVSVEFVNFMDG